MIDATNEIYDATGLQPLNERIINAAIAINHKKFCAHVINFSGKLTMDVTLVAAIETIMEEIEEWL